MKIKSILILTLLFTVISCTKKHTPYFDTILKSEQGIFRGIEIGDGIEAIKKTENDAFLVDNMPDYLYYDYQLDMGNSYTISYDFSDNKLYEIELAAYFDVVEDANGLFKEFSDHFNSKYGKGKIEDDGYTSWRTKSKKNGNNLEIAMVNDSQDYGYLSILISDLDY